MKKLNKVMVSIIVTATVNVGMIHTTQARSYNNGTYSNTTTTTDFLSNDRATATALHKGMLIITGAKLKNKYHITDESKMACWFQPNQNSITHIQEHLQTVLTPKSLKANNDFYTSDLGKKMFNNQFEKPLKSLGRMPRNQDNSYTLIENQEMDVISKTTPFKVLHNLTDDYHLSALMRAHIIVQVSNCNIKP